jgi:hypothetical protein
MRRRGRAGHAGRRPSEQKRCHAGQSAGDGRVPNVPCQPADVAAGTIRFDVLRGKDVKLSEIQAAIKRFKVMIPPEQQFIPRECRLLVAGPTTQEAADKLVADLQERKLFQKLTGRFDWKSEQVELSVECAEQPARPQLEAALAEAGAGYRLADIVWSAGPGSLPSRG